MSQQEVEIHAGPSPTSLTPIPSCTPHPITTPHFTGHLTIRIRHPQTPSLYFNNTRRLFSIQLTGQFTREWNGDDILFGIELEKEIRLPYGADIAVKIARCIDPGLEVVLRGEKPWALSPILCSMNVLNIRPAPVLEQPVVSSHSRSDSAVSVDQEELKIVNGQIEEQNLLETSRGMPMSSTDRRKHFLTKQNRTKFSFSPDNIYQFDFYNQYLDLNNTSIRLPGFSIDVSKYLNGQMLQFVARSRCGITFFAVAFDVGA